ncbi:MAG: hypothetical protein ACI9QQ_002673 [Myxococcota bacterium]
MLPRSALHGKTRVMIVDAEQRLRFREINVLRLNRDEVLIQGGLVAGDRVCISTLDTAMDGMLVRVRDDLPKTAATVPGENPS